MKVHAVETSHQNVNLALMSHFNRNFYHVVNLYINFVLILVLQDLFLLIQHYFFFSNFLLLILETRITTIKITKNSYNRINQIQSERT